MYEFVGRLLPNAYKFTHLTLISIVDKFICTSMQSCRSLKATCLMTLAFVDIEVHYIEAQHMKFFVLNSMEYENASKMHFSSGHTIESPLKLLYKDLPNVVVDDIERDDNLGRACFEDFSSSYDYSSGDDNSKGDGFL